MCNALWYKAFLDLNPQDRLWRDLVVDYAETMPGTTLEYLRRQFPQYWFDSMIIPPGMAGASVGLTHEEETKIVAEMLGAIIGPFDASPDSQGSSQLEFPPPGGTR